MLVLFAQLGPTNTDSVGVAALSFSCGLPRSWQAACNVTIRCACIIR
jgi:hypothetical protein